MSDLSGQTIGPYRLVDKLGDGGMATVYKAYHPRLDRYIALKCIYPELVAAPGFLQRFEREAQILARLTHPNIVHLYDFGEANGHCYLAMEYGAGGTLKDRHQALHSVGRCMSLDEVQRVLLQVSAGLDYAHQHGILHRDIKPSNILLTDDGRALLSDFGLARIADTPSDLTSLGAMLGTPAYLSPEQGRGETAHFGPASDVYALGVVLYELVTGRVPFTAETPLAVVLKQLNEPIPSARALNPALPAALEPVLRTALAKDPAARYQRAGELAQAFQGAVAVTVPSRLAPALGQAQRREEEMHQSVHLDAPPQLSAQADAPTITASLAHGTSGRAMAAEQPVPFGALLRHEREAAGLAQEDLAERAGLTAAAIGALERGERKRPYPLIHTKLRLPFTRPGLVSRPRLQEQIAQGLRGPLTLITAPAGFGKTTLAASCIASCGMPVAWLSLDKNDDQVGRFLNYVVAALQETDTTIGSQAAQLLAASPQAAPETILASLINDLDSAHKEMILVVDDYQFMSNQAVHEQVAFLLEHCPNTLHLVIASRSDPPLPLARLRARGQTVELRAADLRFTEVEAAQFLNDVMGLHLDTGSVAVLEERTEGWVAGLQMAALSMRDREDVLGFIEAFSGTNRYILDYLLEEVLDSQSLEIQRFLLCTSILERLTAPLCDAVLANDQGSKREGDDRSTRSESLFLRQSASTLEYLERANLFLVPLDDERKWYRYHHLFADLLRTQLHKSLGDQGVARLHLRAAAWHEQNGSILEAIHHASLASDFERIERLIEQNYIELMNRGEMSWIRFWMGKLSKELVYRRPWLCLYEAFSRSWFGQLEEAHLLLNEAEKRIQSEVSAPDTQAMLGYHAYVQSRVSAMQGDTRRAIEFCLTARENVPANNLGLQIEIGITLGYEYFLVGDFINANKTLYETIRSCYAVRAITNPVAAYALLARSHVVQGLLHDAYDLFQKAAQVIHETGGQYLGAIGLVEVGIAALLCEWNEVEAALVRVKQGLDFLPLWGKADDLCLAYTTLSRMQLAQGNRADAVGAIEKAARLIQTGGVFSEARSAVETTQVKLWLVQGDWLAVDRWVATLEKRFGSYDPFRYEDELTHITQARVFIAQNKLDEAMRLLSYLEESAQSGGRQGRLIEIMILKALALQEVGSNAQAGLAVTKSLTLAEPSGYVRVFLDEGQPMQMLLAQWLAHASPSPLREYAIHLLSQFDAEPQVVTAAQEKASPTGNLIEPLSQRELEVLHLMALGRTNQEIARQLIVAPGTVKAHTASIYGKLNVANRTEAVARARQLGILP